MDPYRSPFVPVGVDCINPIHRDLSRYPDIRPVYFRFESPLSYPPRGAGATPLPVTRPCPALHGSEPARAVIFTGCFAEHYEGPARAALTRLLHALGIEASFPQAPVCCGALHLHGGDRDTAASLTGEVQRLFGRGGTVLSLASGCHDMLTEALGESAVDAIVFIAAHADRLRFKPRTERVALHIPCTQRNVVRSDGALRDLLARVPALEIVVLDAGFGCCGAAGTQMLTMPAHADRYRQPLLDQLAARGASRILSANIGCRLHLANGSTTPVQHPLEFLAESLI